MMTPQQLKVIHIAKRQLGFDDDVYRSVLKIHGGVESAKQLNAAGFDRVMAYFKRQGFRSTWSAKNFGDRPGMASPRQIKLIRDLWRQFTGHDDEAALNRWLERSFKVSALRFLPAPDAQKAITGLKHMSARKHKGPENTDSRPNQGR